MQRALTRRSVLFVPKSAKVTQKQGKGRIIEINQNINPIKERNKTMAKVKMVCFDMDGTIADLYGVNGWLNMLREENPTPYEVAEPMWDMAELHMVLNALQMQGIEVRIVTWLSMNSTEDYKAKTRKAKMEWLEKYNFPYNNFHGIAYGTTKANAIRKYLAVFSRATITTAKRQTKYGMTVCIIQVILLGVMKMVTIGM